MMRVHSHAELQRQMAAAQAGTLQTGTVQAAPSTKFNQVRTTTELGKFDSKHEAKWAQRLADLQAAGIIENLKLDKRELRFALDVNGVRICDYTADARFDVCRDFQLETHDGSKVLRKGAHVVVDAKSAATRKVRDYPLRRNLMLAVHRIVIVEV